MIADVRAVVDVRDLRVLEDRALGDELAVLDAHGGDLHGHAGVQARGQAGADLEAEQAAAEQRVAVAVVGDDLGHRVDHRLGEALGRPWRGRPWWRRRRRASRRARRSRSSPPTTIAWHSPPSSEARRAPSETAPSEFLLMAPS